MEQLSCMSGVYVFPLTSKWERKDIYTGNIKSFFDHMTWEEVCRQVSYKKATKESGIISYMKFLVCDFHVK